MFSGVGSVGLFPLPVACAVFTVVFKPRVSVGAPGGGTRVAVRAVRGYALVALMEGETVAGRDCLPFLRPAHERKVRITVSSPGIG